MGPATAAAKTKAFNIRIYGVMMNTYGTAENFGFGLTNTTTWTTSKQVLEYKSAADVAKAGSWAGLLPIDVTSIFLSGSYMRSTTDITMEFKLPKAYGATTASNDMVAIQLPW
jgi:hypothetical protein